MINLFDKQRETQSQQFIKIYQGLKSQGALDEEKIFETSVDLLQQQRDQMKTDIQETEVPEYEERYLGLTASFKAATESRDNSQNLNETTKHSKEATKDSIGGINIQNLFKD